MKAMNRISRAVPILAFGALALTGCDLDLTDPNNPSEEDVLGSISAVLQVAVGLQQILGLADKERDAVVANLTDVLERSRKL